MSFIRELLIVLCAASLGGCTATGPTTEFSLAQQQHYEGWNLYLLGNTPASLRSAKRLGTVSGISCREALFGNPPSLDGAMEYLKGIAGAKGGAYVVDILCRETSPLVTYETGPITSRACWPGLVCTGVAVK